MMIIVVLKTFALLLIALAAVILIPSLAREVYAAFYSVECHTYDYKGRVEI